MLVDTHCHLDAFATFLLQPEVFNKNASLSINPEYNRGIDFLPSEADLDTVIRRAKGAGVNYFINIGSNIQSSFASIQLTQKYPEIFASVGVHPHDADSFNQETENKLKELAKHKKVVAIGETGLDYYRNLSDKACQKEAFKKQINLAKERDLPLVIHSRQAQEDVMEILKSFMPVKAVIHCFSGDNKFLTECLDCGFFISFTCNVTYKKAQDLRDMVNLTPLDKLLLETDSPYLSPEGFRGKRNEPAQIKLLAQEISRIRGVSFEEIENTTTANAIKFFNLE